ncbi:MAG: hypothetical protein MRERV_53c016 [Mycoplasmataceae bacterium RV_VA103A]|nr:MAG: hypothetical protein MRERV_53c016 [Mycoplasmataceae bacterium RV_VA103A]
MVKKHIFYSTKKLIAHDFFNSFFFSFGSFLFSFLSILPTYISHAKNHLIIVYTRGDKMK